MIQPVGSLLLAAVIFSERPNSLHLVGVGIVLVAVLWELGGNQDQAPDRGARLTNAHQDTPAGPAASRDLDWMPQSVRTRRMSPR